MSYLTLDKFDKCQIFSVHRKGDRLIAFGPTIVQLCIEHARLWGGQMKTIRYTTACRRSLTRLAVGMAVGALIVSTSVVGANAATQDAEAANDVADLVSSAAPDGATPIDAVAINQVVMASAGGTEAAISLSGGESIQVQTSVDGQPVAAQIELPDVASGSHGTLADDGTVVYGSASEGAVAVQTLPEGQTRIQTVISDRAAEHEFGYGMEGFHATIDENGNAAFVTNAAEGALVPVEPAWAVDANGASVETYYEVRGDRLFQVVVPSADTAYPVVADPTWGWRNAAWGVTLSRSETAISSRSTHARTAGPAAEVGRARGGCTGGFRLRSGRYESLLAHPPTSH